MADGQDENRTHNSENPELYAIYPYRLYGLGKPDLDLARHTIDLMAMLQEKTRGNLTLEEQRLLDNSLTLLRFRYVQAAGEAKKQTA